MGDMENHTVLYLETMKGEFHLEGTHNIRMCSKYMQNKGIALGVHRRYCISGLPNLPQLIKKTVRGSCLLTEPYFHRTLLLILSI